MEKAAPSDHVRRRLVPVQTRVELVKDKVPISANYTVRDMIRDASARYAEELLSIFSRQDVDIGRAIAAIDAIQTAKNIAYDAVELPGVAKRTDEQNAKGQ